MGIFFATLAWPLSPAFYFYGTAVVALGVSILTVPLGTHAEKVYQERDPKQFVLDEVAGYFVSLIFLTQYSLWTGGLAFLAFRLLDIAKPWPIRKGEGLRGGWGILMDDLLAGLIANQFVRLACVLIPFPWA
jgi:phosphatidylglycerophosphatase A